MRRSNHLGNLRRCDTGGLREPARPPPLSEASRCGAAGERQLSPFLLGLRRLGGRLFDEQFAVWKAARLPRDRVREVMRLFAAAQNSYVEAPNKGLLTLLTCWD